MKTSGGSTGGGEGGDRPLDWGQKKFIARPKNTHLQTRFCMAECAKTHLQQSRISKFSGEDPRTPSSRGGEGRGREGRRGRGKRKGGEGQGREGGREGRNGGGGEGRGARHGLRPP